MTVKDLLSKMINADDVKIRIMTYNPATGIRTVKSTDDVFNDMSKYDKSVVSLWQIHNNTMDIIIKEN